MTRNQIAYWQNVETERSNKANEAESKRSNLAREIETKRHNVATETQAKNDLTAKWHMTANQLAEQRRHNTAQEGIANRNLDLGVAQLQEQKRHNINSEKLGVAQHNLNVDRHALDVLRRNDSVQQFAARYNLDLTNANRSHIMDKMELLEKQRHNMTTEDQKTMDQILYTFGKVGDIIAKGTR